MFLHEGIDRRRGGHGIADCTFPPGADHSRPDPRGWISGDGGDVEAAVNQHGVNRDVSVVVRVPR